MSPTKRAAKLTRRNMNAVTWENNSNGQNRSRFFIRWPLLHLVVNCYKVSGTIQSNLFPNGNTITFLKFMTPSTKSGLHAKQATDGRQFLSAPCESHCESNGCSIRGMNIFNEERMCNLPFATDPITLGSHGKSIEDDETAETETVNNAIFNAAPDSIVALDHDGAILRFNQAAERTFGLCCTQAVGKNFTDTFIAPECREDLQRAIEHSFSCPENAVNFQWMELTGRRADGSLFPAELTLTPIGLRRALVFTVFIRDISEKKRAEALQLGQNRILNLIATGSPLHDTLIEISNFAEYQSGRSMCSICRFDEKSGEWSEQTTQGVAPCCAAHIRKAAPSFHAAHESASSSAEPIHLDDHLNAALWTDGCDHVARNALRTCVSWPISGKSGTMLGKLGLHFGEEITPTAHEDQVARICAHLAGIAIERLASEEKIKYLAHYDGLTSLPNRFLFNEYLSLALRNARRSGKKFAVLFVDLDKFKEINDTLGHAAGDLALYEIAERMRNCLRSSDKIARMGGDEFYVLAEDLNDGYHAADIARKLLDAASGPMRLGDTEHQLSASIGISIYPQDGEESQTLLKNADWAMYRAKELGKNRYQFFSTSPLHSNAAQTLRRGRYRSTAIMENR